MCFKNTLIIFLIFGHLPKLQLTACLHVFCAQKATYSSKRRNFTLLNLQRGAKYCVQVHTLIRINRNTKTSNWTCMFSSIQQPTRGGNLLHIRPVCECMCVHVCVHLSECVYMFVCSPYSHSAAFHPRPAGFGGPDDLNNLPPSHRLSLQTEGPAAWSSGGKKSSVHLKDLNLS